MTELLKRITISLSICHGKACVRNMRWPVEVILDMLGAGRSNDSILADHPELELGDIKACLAFARISVSGETLQAN